MQRDRFTLEEIKLTEERDGSFHIRRAGVTKLGTEFQRRISVCVQSLSQGAKIHELKNIAGDCAGTQVTRITTGSDEAQGAKW